MAQINPNASTLIDDYIKNSAPFSKEICEYFTIDNNTFIEIKNNIDYSNYKKLKNKTKMNFNFENINSDSMKFIKNSKKLRRVYSIRIYPGVRLVVNRITTMSNNIVP